MPRKEVVTVRLLSGEYEVVEMGEEFARKLVGAGKAEYVGPPPIERAVLRPPETRCEHPCGVA